MHNINCNEKDVYLIDSIGNLMAGKILFFEESQDNEDEVEIVLKFENKILKSKSECGFFEALKKIRLALESDGFKICCNGGSLNVYPSPMIKSMGYGEKAYKLTIGKQATNDDLVSIFDQDESTEPATVEEQENFYIKWLKSLQEKKLGGE